MAKKYTEKYYARHGDPRTADWLLMDSPLNIIFILAVYFSIVKLFLPIMMRHQRPYVLQNVMFVYNLIMAVLNAWILFEVRMFAYLGNH
ncbi:hypothetical protein NPIL_232331 [Nephila pilipes]|uniref:Very-long-chain 3-oxoacyl-CoA synthase n=1 Tax=Nephila pilipes TaxID=299642 RepID=A0A8X6THG9_NEPPI|nr:hypothetical protein NPIL_232331 [Nephila pilipes]